MGIKDLLNGVVMENGRIDFGKEGERLERLWRFYKDCADVIGDVDSAWDYGEEIAVDILARVFKEAEQTLKEILDDDFAHAEYGNHTEQKYLDLLESREYELKARCAPALPFEKRLIELWEKGDRDAMLSVLCEIEHVLGEKFSDEEFWRRVAA